MEHPTSRCVLYIARGFNGQERTAQEIHCVYLAKYDTESYYFKNSVSDQPVIQIPKGRCTYIQYLTWEQNSQTPREIGDFYGHNHLDFDNTYDYLLFDLGYGLTFVQNAASSTH